jgi:hypothetical protein
MRTLSTILSTDFGFLPDDFGSPGGVVVVDSRRGVLHPVGSASKAVALAELFSEGQCVIATGTRQFRFVVAGVSADGLDAVSPSGQRGFLPWEIFAGALRTPDRVHIEAFDDPDDLDEEARDFVGDEIERLKREAARLRGMAAALDDKRDRLKSIGGRPTMSRPSSWLGE